jgi:hypothetical protein
MVTKRTIGCCGGSETIWRCGALSCGRGERRRGVSEAGDANDGDRSRQSAQSSMVWRQIGHCHVYRRRRLYHSFSRRIGTLKTQAHASPSRPLARQSRFFFRKIFIYKKTNSVLIYV